MAEELTISNNLSKAEQYRSLLPQLEALLDSNVDVVANLANTSAALKQTFGWLWVGFYQVKQDQLVLGPFQGPVACTTIKKGAGVCGKAWEDASTIVVPDVDLFPGHIACSSDSKSEIVVPIFKYKNVVAVLDADSADLDTFDNTDKEYLEQICEILAHHL